jgi:hypothetical protein
MNKLTAIKLQEQAIKFAEFFSDPDRKKNYGKETYTIDDIYPLSGDSAAIVYKRHPTGKKAVVFGYYMGERWHLFFPTDGHVLGMETFWKFKQLVENHNWSVHLAQ